MSCHTASDGKASCGSIAETFLPVLFPSIVWTLPQASCWGLMEAVERFDPTKGTKFGTYAVHWIRCKCSEVAAAERDVIYVPYEAAQRRAEVANAQSALKTALDRLGALGCLCLPVSWCKYLLICRVVLPKAAALRAQQCLHRGSEQDRNQCTGRAAFVKQAIPPVMHDTMPPHLIYAL